MISDKGKAKMQLIKYKISTLPFQIFTDGGISLHSDLHFPLIVKPIAEGSSAGITNKSVVNNITELKDQINLIISSLKQRVIVEPFITGREFSIPMLGNPPKLLPIIEANHTTLPPTFLPLDSLEVKWFYEEEANGNHLICPPHIPLVLENNICDICTRAWEVLGVKDFCRMDIRCDNQGNPYLLDINSPPGLLPPEISNTSYFPLAARAADIEYENLLKRIILITLKRQNN
jgi:D-alanine-D-alanine ligase